MPEFEKVAFELEASSTGSPKWGEAKTSEGELVVLSCHFPLEICGLLFIRRIYGVQADWVGYHIIMVDGRK